MKTNSVESKPLSSVQSIVMIGMCTAIIAVLSQLSIPLPSGVPITLQTFAMALTGYLLGWKAAGISTLIYVLLGCVGVPVFSHFKAGITVLFGKTGGFIFGFIFMSILCGLAYSYRNQFHHILFVLLSIAGLLICHLFGVLQFMILTHMSFWSSALLVSVPYLPKDIFSMIFAYCITKLIKPAIFRS